ncbi:glutamate--tRNA ligase family protein [Mucilaginibacter gotjawali]|uniref:Glutamyl-tRNA synthetase n=1 Tax=Mucilaginibacter gotjawali TaxID=1550579 RepID=A0A839SHN0_9SPHI|nr:glutamate--tRNA ligase family protein [Mucilaginibacter gotjawali]MBB3056794.1 glutamyl-tRNA synthetase [Mucilaginibacter gotjawali]
MPIQSFRFNKTRLAPTPSGFLHLGNILSFIITATLARKTGAKILLRIDDLDQLRVNQSFIRDVFDSLNFLEIPWDEGPRDSAAFESGYSQIHRMGLYEEALRQLAGDGKVFACTCSRKQLINTGKCSCINLQIPLDFENAAWRLITDNKQLAIKSITGEGIPTELPVEMRNFIVKKKDGFPAYQLTSVIDDLFYGIDLVIRGEDLWTSTIAQHQLAIALGKDQFAGLAFCHHPLLKAPNGLKLSKSSGATSIKYLRENGKTPADICMLIAANLNLNETVNSWQELGKILTRDIFDR